jgi:hypothetical protein
MMTRIVPSGNDMSPYQWTPSATLHDEKQFVSFLQRIDFRPG